jgi:hypothetical protein
LLRRIGRIALYSIAGFIIGSIVLVALIAHFRPHLPSLSPMAAQRRPR